MGASARFPVGSLREIESFQEPADESLAGGVIPHGRVRHGVTDELELGAAIYGPTLAAEAGGVWWRDRWHPLSPAFRTLGTVYAGFFDGGHRAGGDVPVIVSINASSLLEAWAGLRFGIEGVWGDASGQSFTLRGAKLGGLLGVAAGFRSFHALVEISLLHEWWDGSVGDDTLTARGIAFVPSFAVRLRL